MKHQALYRVCRRFALATIVASLCLVPGTRRTHAQPTLFDLGTLGGDASISQGINAMGQVVGFSNVAGNAVHHAFLWTPDVANGTTGTMVDLGVLAGNYSMAYGINDLGVVVGWSNSVDGDPHAFVWTPLAPNGIAGAMIDLGTLGGSESDARDINNIGQIVGSSFWTNPATSQIETHAYLRMPDGAMVDLGTLLGPESYAMSVSENGKVAGRYWQGGDDGSYRAFLWTPDQPNGMTGTVQDLGTLGGGLAFGTSVNSAGQVSGISERADNLFRAFLWTPGATDGVASNPQMRDLGVIGGLDSQAYGMNDAGLVTGFSATAGSLHTFLWIPGAPNGTTGMMFDMQTLGGSLSEAAAVNAANQIAGSSFLAGDPGFDGGVIEHAFVSAPPSSDFSQTITFGALGDKALGDADFTVAATASSGLMVNFGATGGCGVTGSIVHITGGGTCTITASQGGNSIFAAATSVQQSFSIDDSAGPVPQTIAFAPIPNKVASDPDFTVSATATSGLTVTFAAAGECTTNGAAVHLTGVGSCLVTASQAGDGVYAPAEAKRSFLITSTIVTSTLVDIGTLGGGVADPWAINAVGQIVGSSYVADDSEQHAFLWTPAAANGTTGTWTDLGTLGGTNSAAYGVNDYGYVVGVTNMPMVNGEQIGDRAFIWMAGMASLGVLGNGRASEARDINNGFQVVGSSFWTDDPDQGRHAFLWTPPAGMIDLGTLGGVESGATAISSDGKVVGYSQDANGNYRAFLWTPDQPNGTNGTMIDLGTLGGNEVLATDVNAAGQVVGGSTLTGETEGHAFVWTQATGMVDLGTLGGIYSFAIGINDGGMIVGEAQLGSGKRPFMWIPNAPNGTGGTMVPMLTLGGTQARGAAINNLGQITGSSSLDGDPPFARFEEGILPRTHAFVTPTGAGRIGQTITFGTLSNRTFNDADFNVSASASSGLAVSFAAGGTCTIDGATVHLISPGVCTITASQPGDGTYQPAPDVPQQFDIAKGTQAAITVVAPASLTYGNVATLTAAGGSGSGAFGFFAGGSSGCGVDGNQLFVTNAAGRCSVTAFKLGDDYYVAHLSSDATVTLNKASATLSLSNLTQAFTGTAKPVMVTTTPGGIGTVAVTYNGSANAPANAGSYAVVASLASNNYQANATGTLVITPPLKKVALNVAAIVGGVNAVGTVTLTAKAPAGGVPVALSSSNTAIAAVPAVVTVPAGATTAQFPVTTAAVAASSPAVISAVWGATKTAALTVNPAALSGVTVNPKTVVGGGSVTGTVTLTGAAPPSGTLVTLASSKSAAIVPANVTIPAGQTSATFTIATTQVAANVRPSISASYGGVTKTAPLTVAK